MNAPDIRPVTNEAEAAACFALMRQLRPLLASPEEFAARWTRQTEAGYRLLALWRDGAPAALAGFRVQENLAHGRHLYLDDLVTDATRRSAGAGAALMACVQTEARALGCAKLLLDTPMDNTRGHRFYFRNGLYATSLRFTQVLAEVEPRP